MIFYFSATGNTRWAALRLSQALQEQLFFVPEQMEYCLCTAGDSVGDTLSYLRQSIQRNDSLRSFGVEDVASAWSLIMPESYVGLPFMDVDKPEREREKKQRAAERLTGIVESIMERREGIVDVTRGPLLLRAFPHHRQAFPRGERPLRALRYLRQRLPHARHRGRPRQRAPMEARRPLPHLL